jgi:hypothetical protein
MKKLMIIAVLVTAMIVGPAYAQTTAADPNTMHVNWSDPNRPGLVTIRLMGSITVRTHTGKDVIISSRAVSRRNQTPNVTNDGLRRIDQNGAGFTVEESNNSLTISSSSWGGGDNVEIQVPVKTNLKLHSMNGSISVDGVDGDLDIQGMNGTVKLTDIAGSVVANSQNGRLTATIREVAPNRMMSFVAQNSVVDVTLPATTKANLKIRADNGAAFSNFDFQPRTPTPPTVIDNRNGNRGTFRIETDRTTYGSINGGGTEIELRSFNGNVYLRKAQ